MAETPSDGRSEPDIAVADLLGLVARFRLPVEIVAGSPSNRVSSITHDSRNVAPGTLFGCIRGTRHDGHRFAADAVASGATALLVEDPVDGLADSVAQIRVDDTRAAIGPFAAALHGFPSDRMTVVGVTGTNGKTSTCHFVSAVLRRAGITTETLGTLRGGFTTPEAADLQRMFAGFVDAGVAAVVMEVSSHALALHRVDGTTFAAAVFTNLSQDHLDFHGDMESYFAAKARLFSGNLAPVGIVNLDDAFGRRLAADSSVRTVGFSMSDISDVAVSPVACSFTWRHHRLELPMGGRVNVMNALAAATTCHELGIDDASIVRGLASVEQVPGRYERVDIGRDFDVIVDYAHTPDSLGRLLESIRESMNGGRIIVVFGCGGDRDAAKRPLMGAIAAELADSVVVTSDNPRSENPSRIIDEIRDGIPASLLSRVVDVDVDRRRAIHGALNVAGRGDVVVIAGKGHEVTQTIGAEVLPFDDRQVVREWEGRVE